MLKRKMLTKGFTLLEMMLVLVIASSLLVMFIQFSGLTFEKQRRDRTIVQMQQILNAALAYYVNNGTWPTTACNGGALATLDSTNALVSQKYLPDPAISSSMLVPYTSTFNKYFIGVDSNTQMFYVYAYFGNAPSAAWVASARVIAGQLPNGITVPNGSSCIPVAGAISTSTQVAVAASVPPPGQNLNNARSVNFVALYKSGQCVPVPSCPTGMTAQIFAVASQLSGTYDSGSSNAYNITSYTAYNTAAAVATSSAPALCSVGANDDCSNSAVTGGAGSQYWRVCLSVTTERGLVTPSCPGANCNTDTSNMGSVIAITRCVPGSSTTGVYEPTGSTFNVWN